MNNTKVSLHLSVLTEAEQVPMGHMLWEHMQWYMLVDHTFIKAHRVLLSAGMTVPDSSAWTVLKQRSWTSSSSSIAVARAPLGLILSRSITVHTIPAQAQHTDATLWRNGQKAVMFNHLSDAFLQKNNNWKIPNKRQTNKRANKRLSSIIVLYFSFVSIQLIYGHFQIRPPKTQIPLLYRVLLLKLINAFALPVVKSLIKTLDHRPLF